MDGVFLTSGMKERMVFEGAFVLTAGGSRLWREFMFAVRCS